MGISLSLSLSVVSRYKYLAYLDEPTGFDLDWIRSILPGSDSTTRLLAFQSDRVPRRDVAREWDAARARLRAEQAGIVLLFPRVLLANAAACSRWSARHSARPRKRQIMYSHLHI